MKSQINPHLNVQIFGAILYVYRNSIGSGFEGSFAQQNRKCLTASQQMMQVAETISMFSLRCWRVVLINQE